MSVDEISSLEEFAEQNPRVMGTKAWLETIPEWDEVAAGYKKGIDLGTIRRYLLSKGYTEDQLTMGRLNHIHRAVRRV